MTWSGCQNIFELDRESRILHFRECLRRCLQCIFNLNKQNIFLFYSQRNRVHLSSRICHHTETENISVFPKLWCSQAPGLSQEAATVSRIFQPFAMNCLNFFPKFSPSLEKNKTFSKLPVKRNDNHKGILENWYLSWPQAYICKAMVSAINIVQNDTRI